MLASITSSASAIARLPSALRGSMRHFLSDRRAVAAVEFAMVAPIMLAMYFVTIEVAQGIDGNKKVGRIGSMVADLITQSPDTQKSEVDAILQIGQSIIQPYNRSAPTIVVTAIEVTADPNSTVKVAWSRKVVNNVYSRDAAAGTPTTIPAELNVPGTFLIRVESSLAYKPIITWTASQKTALGLTSAFDNIDMKKTYYLRPRISTTIPCSDC